MAGLRRISLTLANQHCVPSLCCGIQFDRDIADKKDPAGIGLKFGANGSIALCFLFRPMRVSNQAENQGRKSPKQLYW